MSYTKSKILYNRTILWVNMMLWKYTIVETSNLIAILKSLKEHLGLFYTAGFDPRCPILICYIFFSLFQLHGHRTQLICVTHEQKNQNWVTFNWRCKQALKSPECHKRWHEHCLLWEVSLVSVGWRKHPCCHLGWKAVHPLLSISSPQFFFLTFFFSSIPSTTAAQSGASAFYPTCSCFPRSPWSNSATCNT